MSQPLKSKALHSVSAQDVEQDQSQPSFLGGFVKAVLATALFRCWHFVTFFTVEAVVVTYLHENLRKNVGIQSTLVGVLGTVLGFVISFRSSSGYDRYSEGRKLWSQIEQNIRLFSRILWFFVPDQPAVPGEDSTEKEVVLGLLEALAISVRHYLRGEQGWFYNDLYPLLRRLPAYSSSLPSDCAVMPQPLSIRSPQRPILTSDASSDIIMTEKGNELPLPATSVLKKRFGPAVPKEEELDSAEVTPQEKQHSVIYLKPARDAPPYHLWDVFPFSLAIKGLQKRGWRLSGRKALKEKAKSAGKNGFLRRKLPLEITMHLTSYVASLQKRGVEGSTIGLLNGSVTQMTEALTGLERILTTPIPFSYAVHIWSVTLIYLFTLPFQILNTLGWLTVPGTCIAAFFFCGLLACAEDLEDPFGYDYSDLDVDHFTRSIAKDIYEVRGIAPEWNLVPATGDQV